MILMYTTQSPSASRYPRERLRIPFESLFQGGYAAVQQSRIEIGPVDDLTKTLSIDFEAKEWRSSRDSASKIPADATDSSFGLIPVLLFRLGDWDRYMPVDDRQRLHDYDAITRSMSRLGLANSAVQIPVAFVGPNGLSTDRIEQYWDRTSLTPAEDDVIEAVRILHRDIERINLKQSEDDTRTRQPFIKSKEFSYPIPLRRLGDGVGRIFGLTLALIAAGGGILLVDEIENGIHHSIFPELWRLVFRTASRLGVQVFATTHSLDCVEGFQEAASESEEEGMVMRLQQKDQEVRVTEFDEEEVGIAIEGRMELR